MDAFENYNSQCETCRYCVYHYKDEMYYCENEKSDWYGVERYYDDTCEEWKPA